MVARAGKTRSTATWRARLTSTAARTWAVGVAARGRMIAARAAASRAARRQAARQSHCGPPRPLRRSHPHPPRTQRHPPRCAAACAKESARAHLDRAACAISHRRPCRLSAVDALPRKRRWRHRCSGATTAPLLIVRAQHALCAILASDSADNGVIGSHSLIRDTERGIVGSLRQHRERTAVVEITGRSITPRARFDAAAGSAQALGRRTAGGAGRARERGASLNEARVAASGAPAALVESSISKYSTKT